MLVIHAVDSLCVVGLVVVMVGLVLYAPYCILYYTGYYKRRNDDD